MTAEIYLEYCDSNWLLHTFVFDVNTPINKIEDYALKFWKNFKEEHRDEYHPCFDEGRCFYQIVRYVDE